ncbi:MAG TPA: GMC family oxidoreductase N-terminal domain-containing protein, partial [Stellaceae bacterium]|nr:GMC family oxidoreductase N-terminal domain-containing protein [Stellaceae bacterium]
MAQGDKVDAVIVGGGAAGILLAAKLGHGGKKVVVLEQGPAWQLSDLVSSQIWSRRLKWGTPPVQLDGKNPIAHNFNTGSGFGGAALHHYANWPRLHPEDFRMKTQYGRGLDWPISYAELRPYYDRIQIEVGVSGDAKAEVWRPPGAPYPLPALKTFRQAEVMAKGFAAIGQRTAPMPQAILSRPYKGRPACIYDGWCDAGCPIGALANPLVTYLPAAQKAGADFRAHSYVTRVLMNDKGDRALGVEYYDAQKER